MGHCFNFKVHVFFFFFSLVKKVILYFLRDRDFGINFYTIMRGKWTLIGKGEAFVYSSPQEKN
jgi:hypothetical protein